MLVFVVRIWLGVSGNGSLASLDVIVSGLELMIASTSHIKACKDPSFNRFPCSCSSYLPFSDSAHVTCSGRVKFPVDLLLAEHHGPFLS